MPTCFTELLPFTDNDHKGETLQKFLSYRRVRTVHLCRKICMMKRLKMKFCEIVPSFVGLESLFELYLCATKQTYTQENSCSRENNYKGTVPTSFMILKMMCCRLIHVCFLLIFVYCMVLYHHLPHAAASLWGIMIIVIYYHTSIGFVIDKLF